MPAEKITVGGLSVDLSPRAVQTLTVAGSPGAASETAIATVTLNANAAVGIGVLLLGWAAFTIGTSGASARLRIRQGGVGGTLVPSADTGATTGGIAAGNLVTLDVNGMDLIPALPGQQYTLTLTIGSGAATSTVSAVQLVALAV